MRGWPMRDDVGRVPRGEQRIRGFAGIVVGPEQFSVSRANEAVTIRYLTDDLPLRDRVIMRATASIGPPVANRPRIS
jgi:hypothetical protein